MRKVSIIPRGMALGVTFSAPDTDRFNYDEPELKARIKVALGGRAAEEVVFGEHEHRRRVRHPAADGDRPPDGRPLGHERGDRAGRRRSRATARARCCPAPPRSPRDTQQLIDEEVRRIVEEAHEEVRRRCCARTARKLDALAEALLEHETLDEDDAYAAAGVPRTATGGADALEAAARARID